MLLKSRYGVLAVFAALVWCSVVWYRIQQHDNGHAQDGKKEKPTVYTKDDWIEANIEALESQDWDEGPLTELCAETEWRDDVVFECSQIDGGIANVRNEFLSCLRYAISSGASIILPTFYTSPQARTDRESAALPLSHFFNSELFISRLNSSCPQLRIYNDTTELENAGPVLKENHLHPSNLPHYSASPVTSVRNHVWKLADTNMGAITLIPFGPVESYYPICTDEPEFANTFGSILPFSQPLLRLASEALWTLKANHSMHLNPGVVTAETATEGDDKSHFWGIHLPTYSDDLMTELDYGARRKHYFKRMKAMESQQILTGSVRHPRSPLIYLASETQTGPNMFVDGSSAIFGQELNVLTKDDLLDDKRKEEMAKLDWDQAQVIDYLVLLRSKYFLGAAESSFSWAVSVKRRSRSAGGSCGGGSWWWTNWWRGTALSDELSEVAGREVGEQRTCLWP